MSTLRKNYAVIRASDGAVVNAGYCSLRNWPNQANAFGPGYFVVEPPVEILHPNEWKFAAGQVVERADSELL